MRQVLENFLLERKTHWIAKQTKGKEVKEEKLRSYQEKADKRYDLKVWLEKAIKQARPFVTSHPSTFTHSGAKTTAIHFSGIEVKDGFLKSGNVRLSQGFDVFGNAATDSVVWDTYLFLNQIFKGKFVLEHFKEDSEDAKAMLSAMGINYEFACSQFMKLFDSPEINNTNYLVKQVYFPVDKGYHLLSLVSSSLIMAEMKRRIDEIKFSEVAKEVRDKFKKNLHSDINLEDLPNLVVVGFGGTKPRNVSVINSQNDGKFYLLPCLPASFKKRKIRFPKTNFFTDTLRVKDFKSNFHSLHRLMKAPNNIRVETSIENILRFIIDQVLTIAFRLREEADLNWTDAEHYQKLKPEQKIWLDNAYKEKRETDEEWIKAVSTSFAIWILNAYKISLNHESIMLSDDELTEIEKYVIEAVKRDQELLR